MIDIPRIRADVVRTAERNVGYGEEGGNNLGSFIEALGAKPGKPTTLWCALYAGHCYRRSFYAQGLEPPVWLFRDGDRTRPEPGARRLANGIAGSEYGFRTTDLRRVLPGDVGVIPRGRLGLQRHIFLVTTVDLDDWTVHTLGGNEGTYPAKVRPRTRDPLDVKIVFSGLRLPTELLSDR